MSGRRAKAGARQETRAERRGHLTKVWKANCKRRREGWPGNTQFSKCRIWDFDAQGKPITLEGESAWKIMRAHDRYLAELQAKVVAWPNRKAISGADVMEILKLCFELTNHPAYEAARKAMILHRLDRRGLKQAFNRLQRRHHAPPEVSCVVGSGLEDLGGEPDCVTWFMEEFGYSKREAVEHAAASWGIPAPTLEKAAEKVRQAYAKRHILRREQEQYWNEIQGVDEGTEERVRKILQEAREEQSASTKKSESNI
jgi:hypothetical protein